MVNYLVHALSGFVSNVLAKELPFKYLRSKSKVFEYFFSPLSPVWFPRECYRRSLSSQGSFKRKFSDGRDISKQLFNGLFNCSNHSYNSLNWFQSDRCIWGEFKMVPGATTPPSSVWNQWSLWDAFRDRLTIHYYRMLLTGKSAGSLFRFSGSAPVMILDFYIEYAK